MTVIRGPRIRPNRPGSRDDRFKHCSETKVKSRPWTTDDIAKLKSLARRLPTVEIANELGRGVSATVMKRMVSGFR
jgi:hypothetical protein